MISPVIHHARRHVIAYIALVCSLLALGGTAYAGLQIPNGAVGEPQIRNHVIDPVKWDPNYVAGFVRRWATVSPSGAILSAGPGGQATTTGTGSYAVTWGDAFAGWCAPVVTVLGGSINPPPTSTTSTSSTTTTSSTTASPPTPTSGVYADASIATRSGQSTVVAVATYNSLGQPTNEPFSLAVICGPGAGSGQSVPANLP